VKRFAIALLLIAACTQEQPAPELPSTAPTDAAERTSILDITRGTTVVDRTGEVMLDYSPLRAIDGEPGSFWMNPPGDLPQSMTFALATRSRIDKVGIRTMPGGGFTAGHVTFEGSSDGRTFTPLITIRSSDTREAQWFDIKPFDASSIRVTVVDGLLPDHDVRLFSLLAHGTPVENNAHAGSIDGCWTINGEKAQFVQKGSHIGGVLMTGKAPMHFDGGFDGTVLRLSWIQGNDYGLSLLTVSPDGRHLSGLNWHEEAIPLFFDTTWIGERAPCTTSLAAFDVPMALLRRTGRFSLFDTSDLSRLMKAVPNAQLVAHEFRFATAEENRRAAQQALDRLHLPGVAQGSADPRQEPVTQAMRELYSTVDLQIRR
jgi:hypothetical protein